MYENKLARVRSERSEIPGVMSQGEWEALGDTERRALFDLYKDDYAEINRGTSDLALATFWSIDENEVPPDETQVADKAEQKIEDFRQAVKRLPHFQDFVHVESYFLPNRRTCWRNVRFNYEELNADGIEVNTEALQLFVALREVMSCSTIRHVEFSPRGRSFWSAVYLCRLLDWKGGAIDRLSFTSDLDEDMSDWMGRIGGPVAACRYVEAAARCLATLESSISKLQDIRLCIDTADLIYQDELVPITGGVSRILKQGRKLRGLKLIFDPYGNYYYKDNSLVLPSPEEASVIGSIFNGLFQESIEHKSLKGLVNLEMSVVTTEHCLCALLPQLRSLRHLTMNHVCLLPGAGAWEPILQVISANNYLETIKLHYLEDALQNQPRLILSPLAPAWQDSTITREDYLRYESAIVGFVLRRAELLPPLCPHRYLQQRKRMDMDINTILNPVETTTKIWFKNCGYACCEK